MQRKILCPILSNFHNMEWWCEKTNQFENGNLHLILCKILFGTESDNVSVSIEWKK